MFGRKHEPLFEIDYSTAPPSCLPTSIDRSGLIDITAIGDQWRKYIDPSTGRVHDGAKYFARAQEAGDV